MELRYFGGLYFRGSGRSPGRGNLSLFRETGRLPKPGSIRNSQAAAPLHDPPSMGRKS